MRRTPLLLALSFIAFACSEGVAPKRPADSDARPRPRESRSEEQEPEEDYELLEALGYVEFVEDSSPDEDNGVILHRQGEAADGYYLICAIPFATATLIDVNGREVHRWSDAAGDLWSRAKLMENGDLMIARIQGKRYELQRHSWAGKILWTNTIRAHHDFCELEGGEILSLSWHHRTLPLLELSALPLFKSEPKVRDNLIVRVDAAGEIKSKFSLGVCLAAKNDQVQIRVPDAYDPKKESNPDLFHCNSIFAMEDPDLAEKDPIYALGNVLVSSRYQNLLFIVNPATKELVWHWTDPGIHWQHEASVLDNGNILFFDNGSEKRGYSRILELDPITREIVWEYKAPNPKDFFSPARGTVEFLDNGNILVADSGRGEAFQINRQGEMLWRYRTPFYNEENERGVIRIQFYSREFIEAFLDDWAE